MGIPVANPQQALETREYWEFGTLKNTLRAGSPEGSGGGWIKPPEGGGGNYKSW